MPELLTAEEAAPFVGMSAYSLKELARKKKIEHVRVGPSGGLIRFRREWLEDYLESCRVPVRSGSKPASRSKPKPKRNTQHDVPTRLEPGSLMDMLKD
jgi:excisionase family DNA binding protein